MHLRVWKWSSKWILEAERASLEIRGMWVVEISAGNPPLIIGRLAGRSHQQIFCLFCIHAGIYPLVAGPEPPRP